MLECLIIGDSIAVGLSQFAKHCELQAKVGITSQSYAETYSVFKSELTVISLGSNDIGYDPYESMKEVRDQIKNKVIWLISANSKEGALAALKLANEYNDNVFNIDQVELSHDGVHPTSKGLKQLSAMIKFPPH
jgi:hypothetical protein